ncbi:MAG TPA: peptidase C39 family protein [Candidatus Nanoarchaeia archaeon]|nr:peptidase C39 family protein [Candidatus Nanoarchaeia archaeon]
MKLDVPFYKQTTPLNCGPIALKMVLSYFGNNKSSDILEEKTGIKEGKGISTIQIATAAASLGYKTDFYSKHVLFNEENLKHGFYQKYSDMDLEQSKKWVKEAKEKGANVQEKKLSLEEILEFLTKDSVPIILLDWNNVKPKEERGYQGHFVPIVGYDKDNVYIHNHGFEDTQKFMPLKKETFDKARKAEGTDEDIMVIYRK